MTSELRSLTHDKSKWEWNKNHQAVFERIKSTLSEEALLNYFNPTWETELICDGSPVGVSGILTQIEPETVIRKVVSYVSRKLRDPERRYGQIEREALSIYFSCLKLQTYLLGKHFLIVTDHQPLVHMLNRPKAQMPYRVERVRLKLQGFNFHVRYIPGKRNPSDFISRCPMPMSKDDKKLGKELERHVNLVVSDGMPDAVTLEEIRNETAKDMKDLLACIESGYLDEKRYPQLRCYKNVFRELSVADGVVIKGKKILIPPKLRMRVITAGHDGHQGLEKTKSMLRSKVWYPRLDKDANKELSSMSGFSGR